MPRRCAHDDPAQPARRARPEHRAAGDGLAGAGGHAADDLLDRQGDPREGGAATGRRRERVLAGGRGGPRLQLLRVRQPLDRCPLRLDHGHLRAHELRGRVGGLSERGYQRVVQQRRQRVQHHDACADRVRGGELRHLPRGCLRRLAARHHPVRLRRRPDDARCARSSARQDRQHAGSNALGVLPASPRSDAEDPWRRGRGGPGRPERLRRALESIQVHGPAGGGLREELCVTQRARQPHRLERQQRPRCGWRGRFGIQQDRGRLLRRGGGRQVWQRRCLFAAGPCRQRLADAADEAQRRLHP